MSWWHYWLECILSVLFSNIFQHYIPSRALSWVLALPLNASLPEAISTEHNLVKRGEGALFIPFHMNSVTTFTKKHSMGHYVTIRNVRSQEKRSSFGSQPLECLRTLVSAEPFLTLQLESVLRSCKLDFQLSVIICMYVSSKNGIWFATMCCNERLINTNTVISKLQTFKGQNQQTKVCDILCDRDGEPQGWTDTSQGSATTQANHWYPATWFPLL